MILRILQILSEPLLVLQLSGRLPSFLASFVRHRDRSPESKDYEHEEDPGEGGESRDCSVCTPRSVCSLKEAFPRQQLLGLSRFEFCQRSYDKHAALMVAV